MRARIRPLLQYKYFAWLYLATAVLASVHKYYADGVPNNFLIFRYSFLHYWQGLNLYSFHPEHHFDLFKYSPGFAVLMLPFYWLPVFPGCILWNVLNTAAFLYAAHKLPFTMPFRCLFLLAVLLEFITSIQNFQSNVLMTGLLMLAVFFQSRSAMKTSFFIISGAFIKLFSLPAFSLLFFYRDAKSIFTFLGYSLVFSIAFFSLPFVLQTQSYAFSTYSDWMTLLKFDANESVGYSVMGLAQHLTKISLPHLFYQIPGTLLLVLPLLLRKKKPNFEWHFLSSLLIWVVIFNHKAESPTFILAVSGIAIWVLLEPKWWRVALFFMVWLTTSSSPTDFFPTSIKGSLGPYLLKGAPCILCWIIIQAQLFFNDKQQVESAIESTS